MRGMAQRTGSISTRQACGGKGGELQCLKGGWVWDSVASCLHDSIGVGWLG